MIASQLGASAANSCGVATSDSPIVISHFPYSITGVSVGIVASDLSFEFSVPLIKLLSVPAYTHFVCK
jgi:hypothetical protein